MYDAAFFGLEGKVARESAEVVVPWVLIETGARSVIDIGCGTGEWASEAMRCGCVATGVDNYVPNDLATINVIRADLTDGYPCDGYDLAICLEVAEHLPPEAAVPLVDGLKPAKWVLFSAATPGQPGVGHINCRPHHYWHALFEPMLPRFIGGRFDDRVADFYRRNMYVYGPA